MSESPIKATLKSGRDFDAPWLTIDADNPTDLEAKLRGIIDSHVMDTIAEVASLFQATHNAVALTAPPQQQTQQAQAPAPQQNQGTPEWATAPAPPQSQGWGAAQQAPAPQQQQQQYGGASKFAGPPHPEGKTCDICPNVLEFKKTTTGKGTWRCPEWRWNNGTPNGHSSEFA